MTDILVFNAILFSYQEMTISTRIDRTNGLPAHMIPDASLEKIVKISVESTKI